MYFWAYENQKSARNEGAPTGSRPRENTQNGLFSNIIQRLKSASLLVYDKARPAVRDHHI